MANYSLTLKIDSADLPVLQAAGEQIVLVRQLADAGSTVAWAVLPLAQNHLVTWNDDYSLFASNTPNAVGNVLSIASSMAALAQCDYTYAATGFQGPTPDPALAPDMVQITNTVPSTTAPSVVLGLAQAYGVDGGGSGTAQALNAQSVPARQIAQFTQSQALWVYLASSIGTGMITPPPLLLTGGTRQVMSSAILLQFSSASASQTVRYSAVLGHFYPSN
jgi:hypothetical protein